jgi:hypothetical protein
MDDADLAAYGAAKTPVKLEVNGLLAQADASRLDIGAIKELAHENTRNGSDQDYFEAVRDALQEAIEGSAGNRTQDAGQTGDAGIQEGLTAERRWAQWQFLSAP